MSSKNEPKSKPTYHQDALFNAAMTQFQEGLWADGLEKLGQLMNRYPGDKELSALQSEMQVRSRIDQYEKEENRQLVMRRVMRFALYAVLIVAVAGGVFWGVSEYSSYVQQQVEAVQQAAEENARQLRIYASFRDAQNLLLADRPNEALAKFQEIKEIDAEYPNLDLYIEQAKSMALIEDEYNRAVALLEDSKPAEALEILTRINQTIPNYRDVTLKIEQLNEFSALEVLLRSADTAFGQGNWEDAIVAYSKLRSEDATYQTAFVQRRLYESYLNAIQAIIDQDNPTLEMLLTADNHYAKATTLFPRDDETAETRNRQRKFLDQALFEAYVAEAETKLVNPTGSLLEISAANAYLRSALRFRPDDQQLTALYDLNDLYLATTDQYLRGEWDLAIGNLDSILAIDPNYASGAASQALFDSLIENGQNSLLQSDYEMALVTFQQAIQAAEALPNNTLLKLSAQSEYARTAGLLSRYEDAVQAYQAAVDEAGLLSLAQKRSPELYQKLTNAATFVEIGNYETAYTDYRDVFAGLLSLLDTVSYRVQEGDFLPWIARQNATTTELIMQASSLLSRRIDSGDTLTIPFLPATGTP